MKNFRNITLIAGAIVLAFALLAKLVPGISITDYTLGFLMGLSTTFLLAGVVIAAVPVFCKKDKCRPAEKTTAETHKE